MVCLLAIPGPSGTYSVCQTDLRLEVIFFFPSDNRQKLLCLARQLLLKYLNFTQSGILVLLGPYKREKRNPAPRHSSYRVGGDSLCINIGQGSSGAWAVKRARWEIHATKPMGEVALLDSTVNPLDGQVSKPTRSQ